MVFLTFCLRNVYAKQLHPDFLLNFRAKLKDTAFLQNLLENAHRRGETVDIERIRSLLEQPLVDDESEHEALTLALKIPNWTHPSVPLGDESASTVLRTCEMPTNRTDKSTHQAEKWAIANNWLRMADAGLLYGPKTYLLNGPLAQLESSLVQYALNKINGKSYHLVHVPELIGSSVINGCGFPTDSYRSQVYKLGSSLFSNDRLCLIGTAEMALAGYMSDKCIPEKLLPLKLCAVSRCFRAEASDNQIDKGLYRVHQFYKVEMFVVAKKDLSMSNQLLDELVSVEEEICKDLELSYRVLDIASKDLGLPAFRKFDIEAWLPGHQRFGELTSASNCIDWQSSRLGIRYKDANGCIHFAHTLNGTALAIPRVLIALLETHQRGDSVFLPACLHSFYGASKLAGLARCWRSSPAQNVQGLLDAP